MPAPCSRQSRNPEDLPDDVSAKIGRDFLFDCAAGGPFHSPSQYDAEAATFHGRGTVAERGEKNGSLAVLQTTWVRATRCRPSSGSESAVARKVTPKSPTPKAVKHFCSPHDRSSLPR